MVGERERVRGEIEMTDRPWKSIQGTHRTLQIDKLVYELYGLSEEEIKIKSIQTFQQQRIFIITVTYLNVTYLY